MKSGGLYPFDSGRAIIHGRVLSCKYYQCKETIITAEKKSILHLKNGAKSALGERDLVGCWERKEHEQKQYV